PALSERPPRHAHAARPAVPGGGARGPGAAIPVALRLACDGVRDARAAAPGDPSGVVPAPPGRGYLPRRRTAEQAAGGSSGDRRVTGMGKVSGLGATRESLGKAPRAR